MAQENLFDIISTLESQLTNVKLLLKAHAVNQGTDSGSEGLTVARLELLRIANNLEYYALGPVEWLKASFAVVSRTQPTGD